MAKKARKEPQVGDVFHHRYRREEFTLTVVEAKDGIGYELLGEIYRSPTAAAKAIVGIERSVNGRVFWHVDD